MTDEKVMMKENVRFINPVSRGGMIFTDKRWQQGIIYITNKAIWLTTTSIKDKIPLNEVAMVKTGAGNIDNYRGSILAIEYIHGKEWNSAWLAHSFDYLERIKKLVLQLLLSNVTVYFIAPAVRDNVPVSDARWQPGKLALRQREIFLRGQQSNVIIPFEKITNLEEDPDAAQPLISISYSDGNTSFSAWVIAPREITEMMRDYLIISLQETYPESFSQKDNQVLSSLYMGLDDESIMKIAGMSEEELDKAYEKFIITGLAEVKRVKRVLGFTQKGIKYTMKIMKDQGQEIT